MALVQLKLHEVQREGGSFSVDDQLAKVVWNLFWKAKREGKLKVKVSFFKIDFSDRLAEQLMEWFGEDPVVR